MSSITGKSHSDITTPKLWWELRLETALLEESAYVLIEQGAGGIHFDDDSSTSEKHTFRAYYSGTSTDVLAFSALAEGLGFKLLSCQEVPNENWLKRCSEVWEPLRIDKLLITPVMDVSGKGSATDSDEILILPGNGFGTGHHATTGCCIQLIQSPLIVENPPQDVLDVGTGSGILAITSAKLYGSKVVAVDNDGAALENALDNVRLNKFDEAISLRLGTVDDVAGNFGLIIANIYAEVLKQLSKKLVTFCRPGGHVILSGFSEEDGKQVISYYTALGLEAIDTRSQNGWMAVLLRKSCIQAR